MYQELADMACERITAGITRAFVGERPDQGRARPVQSHRLHRARQLQHVEDRPLGDRRRAAATSTGSSSTATGKPSSAAWPKSHPRVTRLRQEPQPRPRSSVPLRLRERASTCPTSSCWWTTATATDDLLHLIVEIKGYRREDAKEKKIDDGHLLGARREQLRHATAAGRSPSSPRSTRSRPISRRRSRASSTR